MFKGSCAYAFRFGSQLYEFRFGSSCSTLFIFSVLLYVFAYLRAFETETWLKFRDETETSSKSPRPKLKTWRSRLETSKFVRFTEIFKKCRHHFWLHFFNFLAFFRSALVVSYLQIQQTKNHWSMKILINHFFAIFKVSRPETFEAETRPETFETETRKNGSRDESRDSITV